MRQMDICTIGVPTFHSRVEAWECDHNQHWNIRNYLRCFQQADAVAADLCGHQGILGACLTQHTRFHRELFQMSPVLVRSAVLADGPLAGAVVHILSTSGTLSATCVTQANGVGHGLPQVASADVTLALPRGLDSEPLVPDLTGAFEGERIEHGFVQPDQVDHTGMLQPDGLLRRIAIASNCLLSGLGFTPEFTRERKISRMGVELKITRFVPCTVGMRLTSTARIATVARSSIVVHHRICDARGDEVAAADQSLVFVDMTTRRATRVPDSLR